MGKAAKYYNQIKVERNEWKFSMLERCMWCLQKQRYLKLEIHEMERRSQASGRWGSTSNYLLLCRGCHQGEFDTMPHEKQLAVKITQDYQNFDLEEWLSIKPRASSYVTIPEIIQEVKELLKQ